MLALLDDARKVGLAEKLRLTARLVRFEPGSIVLSAAKPVPSELVRELADALRDLTGEVWRVSLDDAPGAPTFREAEASARAAELEGVKRAPVVAAALQAFPDAEITGWEFNKRSEA